MKIYSNIETLIKTKVLCNRHLRAFDKFLINNNNGHLLVGCEIGVLSGCHALSLITHVPIEKLYLIDAYKNYDGYNDYLGNLDIYKSIAKKKMYPFRTKVIFIEQMFQNALTELPKELDFVYYDIHDNISRIKEFLKLYYPIITNDGVIGGWNFNANHSNVLKVVLDFATENNLKLDGINNDWWIKK